ncbi:MAG: IclR family transcriptional regulator [Rhodobacteraceae bacterium]|nr:MAG: IclR family transcriptional regulator [Paracoccaceae bacterium]
MSEVVQNGTRAVGAVVQALRILRHVAASGEAEGVSAIARATQTNTSTCFNILRTLAAEGLVVFDAEAKQYRLGMGVLELAVGLMGTNHGDLIRPELERLALNAPALICLWQITDTERVVLLDRAWNPGSVRVDLPVGKRLPSSVGAIGRAIMAARKLSDDELRRRFAKLRWQRPLSFETYLDSVRSAEQHGYGRDPGVLYAGVESVAAIVPDAQGQPRYGLSAVSIQGQIEEAALHQLGVELATVGQRIGRALFRAPLHWEE